MVDERVTKRSASSLDVALSRQASAPIEPFQDQLGEWQRKVSYIRAMVAHTGSENSRIHAVRDVESILEEITIVRSQLELTAELLPISVAAHSKFQDSVRALNSLSSILRAISPAKSEVERTVQRQDSLSLS